MMPTRTTSTTAGASLRTRRVAAAAMFVCLGLILGACGIGSSGEGGESAGGGDTATGDNARSNGSWSQAREQLEKAKPHPIEATKAKPLRAGERRVTISMPAAYEPAPPPGGGTDVYRCFLLDPGLTRKAYLTGTFVTPGNAGLVHHVILHQAPRDQVARARALDAQDPGEGWQCFGGTGLGDGPSIDDAPWLGAWAPGGVESVQPEGFGVPLAKGTQIVMQVHYNLLGGSGSDTSATQLRIASASSSMTALKTYLMPAPVELPCRKGHGDGPLCDREAAVADVWGRFGTNTADLLHLLCGTKPRANPTQSCDRVIGEPMTIRGVAGHMHLLGRSIKVELNPDTPEAQTVLDIPVWDFDDQGGKRIDPIKVERFDRLRVTCRHTQSLRDRLPAFQGTVDRYVVWGEGTTDEMCLGILQVTKP